MNNKQFSFILFFICCKDNENLDEQLCQLLNSNKTDVFKFIYYLYVEVLSTHLLSFTQLASVSLVDECI